MSEPIKAPAANPCGSCPYRRDVPSGVWDEEEYAKLPTYDGPTHEQPPTVFMCHQQNGCLCAGWVAVHDMGESMGLRLAVMTGQIDAATVESEVLDYTTTTQLWSSGAEAAEHGRAGITRPPVAARRTIDKIERKRARKGTDGDSTAV